MDLLRQILQQFARVFNGMTASQRMSIVMLTLAVLVSVVLLAVWSATTQYETLLSDLDPGQANQVITQLDQMREPYRYRLGRIEVRPGRREIVMARLTEAQAIPKVKDPFDWLYVETLAETKGRRDLKYIDALQKKLQMMIDLFESVRSSTVVIARPEDTPFLKKPEEQAKASVFIQLAPSVQALPGGLVRAIAQLVAGGVEGMPPQNVAITDQNGRFYRLPSEEEGTLLAGDQLEMKKQVERYYAQKALDQLAFLNSPGGHPVTAVADVTLDFDRVEKEMRQIEPETVVVSHEKTKESSEESSGEKGAAPGVGANIQMEASSTVGGQQSTRTEEEREITRDYSLTVMKVIQTPGGIKDLSLAVAIPVQVGEDGAIPPTAPTEEQIAGYRNLVMTGTGIKDAGKITVMVAPFRGGVAPPVPSVPVTSRIFSVISEQAAEWAKYAGLIILILIAVLMLRSILKKAIARVEAGPAPVEKPSLPIPEEEITAADQMRIRLTEMVGENPDGAADLIKRWLVLE